ncbi:MAG: hypothetical protein OEZ27_07450 [Nitrospinota bacterium]|nr:hypothetical protein [Nitrospinota bacterium]
MKERNKKELAEFLWLEINRAIINSNNVRNCLKILKQMDMLDFLCQHDYILDGKKLVEKLLDESTNLDEPEETLGDCSMEMFLEEDAMVPRMNKDVDLSKGLLSRQLVRAYGFCKN